MKKVDVLIILGYPANKNGHPGAILKSRLDRGLDAYRNGLAEKIIVTGSAVQNNYVEADVMALYLKENGVASDHILKEPRAVSTYDNARMAKKMMDSHGLHSAAVITSGFHIRRTKYFFSKYIHNIKFIAAAFPNEYSIFRKLLYILKEKLIMLLYILKLGYRSADSIVNLSEN